MGVRFERGDVVVFRHVQRGDDTQSSGVVIDLDDGLLTVALSQGVEVWNMRSALFGSAWRVEHTPGAMTEGEALAFAARRLEELRRRPLVLVEPEDDRPFRLEPHEHELHGHGPGHDHDHDHHSETHAQQARSRGGATR